MEDIYIFLSYIFPTYSHHQTKPGRQLIVINSKPRGTVCVFLTPLLIAYTRQPILKIESWTSRMLNGGLLVAP